MSNPAPQLAGDRARAASTATPFSFELYPPRTPEAGLALPDVITRLAASGPDFISVTYGANGSSRSSSLALLRHIKTHTNVDPMAHLTCVGSSHAEANRLIREFLDAGITSFLALRGDPPAGVDEQQVALGDLASAGELVQLIHRVQAERVPYTEVELPGRPWATAVKKGRNKVRVSVAAFPGGHPRSRSFTQDVDALLAKEAAGADLAITQLFFRADDYLSFVDRARTAGVTMPILPGIMPVTTPSRLHRTIELSGERLPLDLLAALETADSPAQRFARGVEHASRLAAAVIDGGAPGLHLYTFNRYDAVLAVLDGCGLLTSRPSHHPIKESA
ncbi:methylenetetrahydrofolate reductase [Agreia sp.]|uniref:methylenetetrahydrofolate reductase n=1 Tax=Agreia sp. TaxID=1872416 RepID=UPI0035BC1049